MILLFSYLVNMFWMEKSPYFLSENLLFSKQFYLRKSILDFWLHMEVGIYVYFSPLLKPLRWQKSYNGLKKKREEAT